MGRLHPYIDNLTGFELFREFSVREALANSPLDNRSKMRCKNMYALGILYWLFHRDMEPTVGFVRQKFGQKLPDAWRTASP